MSQFFASGFFMNHLPQASGNNIRVISNYAAILESQSAPLLWTTPVAKFATVVNYTSRKFFNYTCNKFATGFQRQQGLICHRWQWHQWQIMGTISDCLHLNVNLKKTFTCIYMLTGYQRCPNKIFKTFPIKDFFHLPPMSTTLVVHLELWISLRIFWKI